MKEMCFSILLERLPEHYHVHYSIPPDFALSAVRVWTASAKNLREDFLYITNDPILLDKSWEKGSPALLYTDRPIEEAQETLLDLLDEYRCWYDSCVELILGGMDLPPFLDHVATVLANPVALFDAAGTLIHQAGTFQSGVGGTLWEEVLRYGIRVQRQILRQNGAVVEAPLKTKNSYRNIAIGTDTVELLRQMKRRSTSEYVFPSPTGGPISPDSVLHKLQRVLKRAGLEKIPFHSLRHTFSVLALQNGVDAKTLSAMLGHYSAGFTLDTYAHVTTAMQTKAANTVSSFLSGAIQ